MSNPAPQFHIPYMIMQNCATVTNLALLATFGNKLYNVNVSTTSKAQRAFLFPSEMGGMVRKVASLLLEVETAMPSFWFQEIKP